MVKVAVMDVALTTVTLEAVTPAPEIVRLAGLTKFAPVRVTLTDDPCAPDDGPIELSVGTGKVTLKETEAVVPFDIVTETL